MLVLFFFSRFFGTDRLTLGSVPVLHAGALRGGAHLGRDGQPHHEANVRGQCIPGFSVLSFMARVWVMLYRISFTTGGFV